MTVHRTLYLLFFVKVTILSTLPKRVKICNRAKANYGLVIERRCKPRGILSLRGLTCDTTLYRVIILVVDGVADSLVSTFAPINLATCECNDERRFESTKVAVVVSRILEKLSDAVRRN